MTKLKEKYPHVKRIYVGAEFPYINDDYLTYPLKTYDESHAPTTRKSGAEIALDDAFKKDREVILI